MARSSSSSCPAFSASFRSATNALLIEIRRLPRRQIEQADRDQSDGLNRQPAPPGPTATFSHRTILVDVGILTDPGQTSGSGQSKARAAGTSSRSERPSPTRWPDPQQPESFLCFQRGDCSRRPRPGRPIRRASQLLASPDSDRGIDNRQPVGQPLAGRVLTGQNRRRSGWLGIGRARRFPLRKYLCGPLGRRQARFSVDQAGQFRRQPPLGHAAAAIPPGVRR